MPVNKDPPSARPDELPSPHLASAARVSTILLTCAAMLGFGAAVALFRHHRLASQPVSQVENTAGGLGSRENKFADYVGCESCRNCHAVQYDHWATSNHAFAERPVRSDMDRDAFEPGRTIKHGSQTSQVHIQDGRFQIITLGFHSNVEPYQVERVVGHAPLR